MDKKLFKNITPSVAVSQYQFTLIDVTFPVGTYVFTDRKNKIAYLCTHFPKNYHGKRDNIILHVTWYDLESRLLGVTTISHCRESRELFAAFQANNEKTTGKIRHELNDADFENMMRHERRKKSGTGGVILGKFCGQTTDNLRYKQVTELAYWANLDNARSGNASIVASSVR